MNVITEQYELYEGDCLVEMAKLRTGSIDCICVDQPYGTTQNAWDSVIPLDLLWQQFKRLIKPNGAIVLFGTQPFTSLLVMSHLKGYKHRWIWNKQQPGNFAVAKFMPLSVDEDILIFSRNGERVNYYPIMRKGKTHSRGSTRSKTNGQGFGGLKNILYHSDEYYPVSVLKFAMIDRKQSQHPSQKPVALLKYLIQTYTTPGQTVLDCCFGSGTTMVAAIETGRKGIGIELDPGYFQIAAKRCADAARAVSGLPKQLKGSAADLTDLPLLNMGEPPEG